MTGCVLDASALLALLLDEPGADRVKAVLIGASMNVVNLAEVVGHYSRLGAAREAVERLLAPLPIRLLPADEGLSYEAGMLRMVTATQGLSLGDRYCLALARREGLPALTAERRWPRVAPVIGVDVELIR